MNQPVTPSASQPTARLVIQLGPQPGQTFDLALPQITIGRSPTNEVSIPDPEISRKHARLARQGNDYAIEDLGSTNGTFVNTRRIVGLTPLHDGDIIEFGESIRLLYEAESTLPVEPVAAQAPQPRPAPRPAPASYQPAAGPPPAVPQAAPLVAEGTSAASCRKNALIGCGVFILLFFCCTATLFFLDAYQQGQLLYCGPLRSFWQLILGPFGFAPLCP